MSLCVEVQRDSDAKFAVGRQWAPEGDRPAGTDLSLDYGPRNCMQHHCPCHGAAGKHLSVPHACADVSGAAQTL
eukprot:231593-Rhodomonas_salina.1